MQFDLKLSDAEPICVADLNAFDMRTGVRMAAVDVVAWVPIEALIFLVPAARHRPFVPY